MTLCSVAWLGERVKASGGIYDARHHVVVDRYDFPRLLSHFEDLIAGISGEDWNEVAGLVGRIGRWEFEDYDLV